MRNTTKGKSNLGRAKCRNCSTLGDPTSWRPIPGFDPAMRQFRCPCCRKEWFQILDTNEQLKAYDTLSKEIPSSDSLTP